MWLWACNVIGGRPWISGIIPGSYSSSAHYHCHQRVGKCEYVCSGGETSPRFNGLRCFFSRVVAEREKRIDGFSLIFLDIRVNHAYFGCHCSVSARARSFICFKSLSARVRSLVIDLWAAILIANLEYSVFIAPSVDTFCRSDTFLPLTLLHLTIIPTTIWNKTADNKGDSSLAALVPYCWP